MLAAVTLYRECLGVYIYIYIYIYIDFIHIAASNTATKDVTIRSHIEHLIQIIHKNEKSSLTNVFNTI